MGKIPNGRKLLTWVVVAFVAYTVFNQPAKAGHLTRTAIATLSTGAASVTKFFDTVAG